MLAALQGEGAAGNNWLIESKESQGHSETETMGPTSAFIEHILSNTV